MGTCWIIVDISVGITTWCLTTLLAAFTGAYTRYPLDVVSVVVNVGLHVASRTLDALVVTPVPWLAVEVVGARSESRVVLTLGPRWKRRHDTRVYTNFLHPAIDTALKVALRASRVVVHVRVAEAAHGLVALIAAFSWFDIPDPLEVVPVQVDIGVDFALAGLLNALVVF